MKACCDLVRKLGGEVVGLATLIELKDLKGREKLDCKTIHTVIQYE